MNNPKYFSIAYNMDNLSDDEKKAVFDEAQKVASNDGKVMNVSWRKTSDIENNGWINPKDHFPDRDVILTYHADGSIRVTDLLGNEYESKITHWQILPRPPKE